MERYHYRRSSQILVGVDEAGRGSLAGPVATAAVYFPSHLFTGNLPTELVGLRDSKQLSPLQREQFYSGIKKYALFSSVILISNRLIDKININRAIEFGIICLARRLQKQYSDHPFFLVDGNYQLLKFKKAYSNWDIRSIVRGDQRIFSIAAASILAKVYRDRRMQSFAKIFPSYQFERNKGYPTASHRNEIKTRGLSILHRHTYKIS